MTSMKMNQISEERYIEIKKEAYKYYEKYNSLERRARESFIEMLPDMGSAFENDVLINTLLFPDTEQLLMCSQGELQILLGKIAKNEDYITSHNISSKTLEMSMFDIKKLISEEKLQVMDPLVYPDNSISDRQYINLKKSSLDFSKKFLELSLEEKTKVIAKACEKESYQAQIQISTLLIPNDIALMEQLKTSSVSELANYYMVPESVINFKIEEYDKQDTKKLINEGSIPENKTNRLWHKDSLDDLVNVLWDQSFYQSIEQKHTNNAAEALDKMFKSYSKNSIK